eukprot:269964-Pelagomonas_calceolata.AAC.2
MAPECLPLKRRLAGDFINGLPSEHKLHEVYKKQHQYREPSMIQPMKTPDGLARVEGNSTKTRKCVLMHTLCQRCSTTQAD